MQNLINFEKALKYNYLPAWQNQLSTEPSPFLASIRKVPLTSSKIKATAPYGLSGGFGFGTEGGQTPKSGAVPFEGFEIDAKDMYCNIEISNKAVHLTGDAGAMANALDTEVNAAYESAKWNVGRSLFGDGSGKLTDISAVTNSNVITVANHKHCKEGLIIDIYEDASSVAKVSARRILSVERNTDGTGKITIDGTAVTCQKGFITVQNSYGKEITGLGSIFDDKITKIYGVEKAASPYLKPTVIDCDGDIDDGLITSALRSAKQYKNSNVNLLMFGDKAFDAYLEYLRVNNIRNEKGDMSLNGGFKAINFTFSNTAVACVNESFVPDNEIWGVDTNVFEFHSFDWQFAELHGGGIFNLMEDSSAYRALLFNYGELICKNPGGCVRLLNCVA